MKKLNVFVFALLFFLVSFNIVSAESEPIFKDVPNNHWAKQAIEEAVANGIVNGYPDGTFKPSQYVTESEFLKMLVFQYALDEIPSSNANWKHWADGVYQVVDKYRIWNSGVKDPSTRSRIIDRRYVASVIASIDGVSFTNNNAIIYVLGKGYADGKIVGELSIKSYFPYSQLTRAEAVEFLRKVKINGLTEMKTRTGRITPLEILDNLPRKVELAPPPKVELEKVKEGFTFAREGTLGTELLPHPETQVLVDQFVTDLKIVGNKVTGKIPNIPSKYRIHFTVNEGTEIKWPYHMSFSHLKSGEEFSFTIRNDVEVSNLTFGIREGVVGLNDVYIELQSKYVKWGNLR